MSELREMTTRESMNQYLGQGGPAGELTRSVVNDVIDNPATYVASLIAALGTGGMSIPWQMAGMAAGAGTGKVVDNLSQDKPIDEDLAITTALGSLGGLGAGVVGKPAVNAGEDILEAQLKAVGKKQLKRHTKDLKSKLKGNKVNNSHINNMDEGEMIANTKAFQEETGEFLVNPATAKNEDWINAYVNNNKKIDKYNVKKIVERFKDERGSAQIPFGDGFNFKEWKKTLKGLSEGLTEQERKILYRSEMSSLDDDALFKIMTDEDKSLSRLAQEVKAIRHYKQYPEALDAIHPKIPIELTPEQRRQIGLPEDFTFNPQSKNIEGQTVQPIKPKTRSEALSEELNKLNKTADVDRTNKIMQKDLPEEINKFNRNRFDKGEIDATDITQESVEGQLMERQGWFEVEDRFKTDVAFAHELGMDALKNKPTSETISVLESTLQDLLNQFQALSKFPEATGGPERKMMIDSINHVSKIIDMLKDSLK